MRAINYLVFTSIVLNIYLLVNINCVKLRGVVLQSYPFITKDGNQYNGYIIDVLEAIKRISDFNYYFYESFELGSIDKTNGTVSGFLGEVWRNRAEFGVSNIEVTEERTRILDFTDPVLNYSISALVLKTTVGDIKTFQELADQSKISYGSLKNSSTMKLFADSNDFVIRRMFALMNSTGVSVDSLQEAVKKVKTTNYAFIDDSLTVEELAKSDCNLRVITDDRQYFRKHISIVVPKGSEYLQFFNELLKQLKNSGKIDEIRAKYWKNDCTDSYSTSLIPMISSNLMLIVLNVLFIWNKI